MDQNNMSGMNFVMGDDSVPENVATDGTLSSVVNQPVANETQPAPAQPEATPAAPTLSSVVNQPAVSEPQPAPVQPEATPAAPTLSSVVNQPAVSEPQPVPAQPEVTPMAPMPSNVVNQPVGVQPQVQNNAVPQNAEDEKQNKLKKILIVVVVLLALTAVGIVLGFVLFDKFGNKGENTVEDNSIAENSNILQANVINNVNVDANDLSAVLSLLGIGDTNIDALTYYVTNENYRDNAKDIITYYAILGSSMTSSYNADDYKDDKGACADAEGCAIVSKDDALKIIKLYDFEGTIDDYFYKSESDEVYGIRYGESLELPQFNGSNLGIGHNLVVKYVGDEDIDIEDTQLFNYNDDEGQFKSTNRVVKYTFKKNEDDEYCLNSVLINE